MIAIIVVTILLQTLWVLFNVQIVNMKKINIKDSLAMIGSHIKYMYFNIKKSNYHPKRILTRKIIVS